MLELYDTIELFLFIFYFIHLRSKNAIKHLRPPSRYHSSSQATYKPKTLKNQTAEATIHVSGADLFAKAESNDMYASIDKLINKLDSQILRHKEKLHSHRG